MSALIEEMWYSQIFIIIVHGIILDHPKNFEVYP